MARKKFDVYLKSPDGHCALNQGELLSGVQIIEMDPVARDWVTGEVAYCLVLSGDCDLENDFAARLGYRVEVDSVRKMPERSEKEREARKQATQALKLSAIPLLKQIILCEAFLAEEAKGLHGLKGKEWELARDNEHARYQFVTEVLPCEDHCNEGIPALLVDFKKLFCAEPEDLYDQIEKGTAKRRAFLASPYMQHFMARFSQNIARVALPERHWQLSGMDHESVTADILKVDSTHTIEEVEKELGISGSST